MVDMFFSIIFVKKGKMENKLNMKYNRRNFLEESSDMEGDSLNSGDRRILEEFNSDQTWEELDELEVNLFNGIVDDNSPEETFNRTNFRTKRPPKNLREKKREVVQQFEKELERIRNEGDKIFYPATVKPPLRLNETKFIQTTIAVMGTNSFVHNMAKRTGLKNSQNMAKVRMMEEITYCREYMETGQIPDYYLQQFQKMMAE